MITPILSRFFDHWAVSCFGADYRTKMPPVELAERERAFMSGFASYYFWQMETTALTDDEVLRQMEAINTEIKTYFAQLGKMPKEPTRN